jgi:hypothetical protein
VQPLPGRRVVMLIPSEADHVGAGSFYVDGGFDDAYLARVRTRKHISLLKVWCSLVLVFGIYHSERRR